MEKKTVSFNSVPKNFDKEKSGVKPNTFRKIDDFDPRFQMLKNGEVSHITIRNPVSGETFTRKVTDYTEWGGYAIISWKHEVV